MHRENIWTKNWTVYCTGVHCEITKIRVSYHNYLHETFIRSFTHPYWCFSFVCGVFLCIISIVRIIVVASCGIPWKWLWVGSWCISQLSNRVSILFSMHFRLIIKTLMGYTDALLEETKNTTHGLNQLRERLNALPPIYHLLDAVANRGNKWVMLGKAMYHQNEWEAWFCYGFLFFFK